ncbi:hypothetical protein GGI12_000798 [Dipsacomyces acuminosporus]|nr:hypothetical protein GGI12_000798 [Dipsacomyces acuminosporus]
MPSPLRKSLFPPVYPCHYKVQRIGYMGLWASGHASILAYFLIKHSPHDLPEGLNLATQYGILTSLMGILLAMSPTFLGLLRRTPLNNIATFEKRIHAHKFMSYILFLWTAAHSSLHYWTGVRYADSAHLTRLFIFWGDRLGITGQLMWMFFMVLGIAALPVVRRLYYEVFYYIHHLYLVNIALLYLHSENGKAARYVTGPLAIFVADYLYRVARSYPLIWSRRARIRYIRHHPCDVVEIGFDRKELLQHTRIGQYVKICVPELGIFQWHPFTITSTPGECKVLADGKSHGIWRIHFKAAGDWSAQFSQRLSKATAGGGTYNNPYGQEARIGRVVNNVAMPEIMPIHCSEAEHDKEYVLAMANRIDSAGSLSGVQNGIGLTNAAMENDVGEATSPIGNEQACRVPLAPKKSEFDARSAARSNNNSSVFEEFWLDPETNDSEQTQTQTRIQLPTILVDGPYSAPMESFFEYQANIIVAAGIGITPYISATERVLEMCADNLPTRTTQSTRDGLLPEAIYLVWVFRDMNMMYLMMDLLLRLREDTRVRNIVVPCLYVTGDVDVEHSSTASDVFGRPMVKLPNGIRISLGRPPIARMVSYMASKHASKSIGVFTCAPKELTSLVRSTVHDTNAAVAHHGTHMVMRSECFAN